MTSFTESVFLVRTPILFGLVFLLTGCDKTADLIPPGRLQAVFDVTVQSGYADEGYRPFSYDTTYTSEVILTKTGNKTYHISFWPDQEFKAKFESSDSLYLEAAFYYPLTYIAYYLPKKDSIYGQYTLSHKFDYTWETFYGVRKKTK